jgi:hypothetical protein
MNLRLTCYVIFLVLVLAQLGFSQSNEILDALRQAPAGQIDVPDNLPMLGANTFQVEQINKNTVDVKLFNSSNQVIATVRLFENLFANSFQVTLTESSGSAWALMAKSASGNEISMSFTTSSGSELLTVLEYSGTVTPDGKAKLSAVEIKMAGTTWQSFTTGGGGSAAERSALYEAIVDEEERVFNTPRLVKLQEAIRGLDVIKSAAIDPPEEQLAGTCANSSPYSLELMPTYSLIQGPVCTGQAFCHRISTLIPIFVCHAGSNSCTGIYIIYGWVHRIFGMASCADLTGCVMA